MWLAVAAFSSLDLCRLNTQGGETQLSSVFRYSQAHLINGLFGFIIYRWRDTKVQRSYLDR